METIEAKKRYLAAYYQQNREKLRAYLREYYLRNQKKLLKRAASYREENKQIISAKSNRRYHSATTDYKQKLRARGAVCDAIRRGKMSRENCRICGCKKSQAHHHISYEKKNWLDVQWLCTKHHNAWHKVFCL